MKAPSIRNTLLVSCLLTASYAQAAELEITVENLTRGIAFTPLLIAAHDMHSHLFTTGEMATTELQAMAEGGEAGMPVPPPLESMTGMGGTGVAATITNSMVHVHPGNLGSAASDALEALAEGGDNSLLIAADSTLAALSAACLHHQLALTATEFALLKHFVENPNQVFTRNQLLNAVWGHQLDCYEHTVVSHINRLRAKLSSDRDVAAMLETVRGVGYRLIPPATTMKATTVGLAVAASA